MVVVFHEDIVSTHSRSKAAAAPATAPQPAMPVSTHSRSKAAACKLMPTLCKWMVSTHSRSKAAARTKSQKASVESVSTHSRSKAAAGADVDSRQLTSVSTHSRSKAAAAAARFRRRWWPCFNSQPLEGGCSGATRPIATPTKFQLTAARRRLRLQVALGPPHLIVSTHSRSKAAARADSQNRQGWRSFNSQPLEGGCSLLPFQASVVSGFNSQPLEGGCRRIP